MTIGSIVLAERDFSSSAIQLGIWGNIQDMLYEKTNSKEAYEVEEIIVTIQDIKSND